MEARMSSIDGSAPGAAGLAPDSGGLGSSLMAQRPGWSVA